MKVILGEDGLEKSWQGTFPRTATCVHCDGEARIAFVAHEMEEAPMIVADLHPNEPPDSFWVHDACVVAVYFCRKCLRPTALANQA